MKRRHRDSGKTPKPDPLRVRIARALGWTNLVYVGLLPAVATFFVLYRYGVPLYSSLGSLVMLAFLALGAGAVAVETAALAVYTHFPRSLLLSLVVLFDGPALALLGLSKGESAADFAVRGFLIDGGAVWLAIGLLALTTPKLEGLPRDRLISAGIGFGLFAGVCLAFWPYLARDIPRTTRSLASLWGGLAWATFFNYRVLGRDEPAREPTGGKVMAYILVTLFAWIGAMIAGNVLHESNQREAAKPVSSAKGAP